MNKRKPLCIVLLSTISVFLLILGMVALNDLHKPYRDASTLIQAIEENDIEKVEKLLKDGIDPNQTNMKPSAIWSFWETSAIRPLSVACDQHNYQMIKLLINYGATAEPMEHTNWSPLRSVLFYYHPGDEEIVKLLLENGADINYEESDVLPVFAAAEMYPMPAGSESVTVGYDKDTAKAITQIVELLLGDNSVNIQTKSGKTLLMLSAKRGNLYLTEYLLDRGCDPNTKDATGKTAYDYAVQAGKDVIITLLRPAQKQ